MLFLEGLARNMEVPLRKVWEDAAEDSVDWWELERFAEALRQYKKKMLLTDYTDMVERFCTGSGRDLPELDRLIIDEIQDLSPLQWRAVELLSRKAIGFNVVIVGYCGKPV